MYKIISVQAGLNYCQSQNSTSVLAVLLFLPLGVFFPNVFQCLWGAQWYGSFKKHFRLWPITDTDVWRRKPIRIQALH